MSTDCVVGNRDRCGRCGARHGGNNHLCRVHGAVSEGCCPTDCEPSEWGWFPSVGLRRLAEMNLSKFRELPPYEHQVGTNYVRRFEVAA